MRKYFNDNKYKSCKNSLYSQQASNGKGYLCTEKGYLTGDENPCKKYTYDPISRIPEKQLNR